MIKYIDISRNNVFLNKYIEIFRNKVFCGVHGREGDIFLSACQVILFLKRETFDKSKRQIHIELIFATRSVLMWTFFLKDIIPYLYIWRVKTWRHIYCVLSIPKICLTLLNKIIFFARSYGFEFSFHFHFFLWELSSVFWDI